MIDVSARDVEIMPVLQKNGAGYTFYAVSVQDVK